MAQNVRQEVCQPPLAHSCYLRRDNKEVPALTALDALHNEHASDLTTTELADNEAAGSLDLIDRKHTSLLDQCVEYGCTIGSIAVRYVTDKVTSAFVNVEDATDDVTLFVQGWIDERMDRRPIPLFSMLDAVGATVTRKSN